MSVKTNVVSSENVSEDFREELPPFTAAQAAEKLGMSESWVTSQNLIPFVQKGRRKLYRQEDVSAFLGCVSGLLRKSQSNLPLLSVTEAAERLGMSKSWMEQQRSIPFVQIATRKLYKQEDLDEFIASQTRSKDQALPPKSRTAGRKSNVLKGA